MDKQYKADLFEDKVYKTWEKSGAFQPSNKGEPYCIIMPPPNANDPLHVGHAMFVTVEDIFTRVARMQGKSVLWLPGTDHAGIETQYVFEKKLQKQGKSRFDYDREGLYKMIWDYVQENSGVAIKQMKKLGASADWSRQKFTLDKDIVDLVIDTFIKLHKDDLVYRDLKLVNFCTKCGTAFSNLEINHVEKKEPLYYLKYGPFTLATTRPETKFGDTAVAVHPDDKRYKKWVGKEIEVEGLEDKFKLKVIPDKYVDPEFGTGVVKITPAHDFNDYEVGKRHNLKLKQVIDLEGRLTKETGKYEGVKVVNARKQVVSDLEKKGLMKKIDRNYVHSVATCYRCSNNIEPLPLPQFFIKVKPLVKKALQALKEKKVKIYGSGHDKILKHWLESLNDWNISRQIVWGIRMPVWYCKNENSNKVTPSSFAVPTRHSAGSPVKESPFFRKGFNLSPCYVVAKTKPKKCDKCKATSFEQETDTFDTWFSSAQWPVVTLKSCSIELFNKVKASFANAQVNGTKSASRKGFNLSGTLFDKFYPTDVMETAYDILPFWVMRMLIMGIYLTNKVPFKKVYFHGLIRDEKGQKMSKSKGNVINPIDLAKKYGADALRMALVIRSTAGRDKNVGEQDIKAMRNLTNKIWNASRFVMEFLETHKVESSLMKVQPSNDTLFKKELRKIVKDVSRQLHDMKPGLAAETVYNKFWHWFCDECIEQSKEGKISKKALVEGLKVFLKLFHPFVPFVTEAVWQELGEKKLLILSKWPE